MYIVPTEDAPTSYFLLFYKQDAAQLSFDSRQKYQLSFGSCLYRT